MVELNNKTCLFCQNRFYASFFVFGKNARWLVPPQPRGNAKMAPKFLASVQMSIKKGSVFRACIVPFSFVSLSLSLSLSLSRSLSHVSHTVTRRRPLRGHSAPFSQTYVGGSLGPALCLTQVPITSALRAPGR